MPLLYYWRPDNYHRDLDDGAAFHLNQASARLHEIERGESLWAFTRRKDGAYVLAAELVITAHTYNSPDYKYGPYRVWGSLQHSRYFAVAPSPSADAVIRSTSLAPRSRYLGQSFQGHAAVRIISPADHILLSTFAAVLPEEPRATLVDEEALERALLNENQQATDWLLSRQIGIGAARQAHLRKAPRRSRALVKQLRRLYEGRCQICQWRPERVMICEAHHLRWLSRGGRDSMENLCLLCPNHHRLIHALDAPFDFKSRSFLMEGDALLITTQHQLSA